MAVNSTSLESPAVSWTLAPEGSLAASLGGLGSITYPASLFCEDPRCSGLPGCEIFSWNGSWSFVVPPEAPSAQLPVLPPELGCWLPTGAGAPRSLAFVDVESPFTPLTEDLYRRFSSPLFHTYFNSLRTRVEQAGTETFLTSYCTEATFCSPRDAPDAPNAAQRIFLGCYSPVALEDLLCF